MKKTIVALYGSSSRGKSTALKTFIHQLKKNKNFDFVKLDDNYSNEKYDIIITNPPYYKVLPNSKINFNEVKSIARHEIKLNLEDLIKNSKRLLENKGEFYIVYPTDRFVELLVILEKYNLKAKEVKFIYSKKETNSDLFMLKAINGGNAGLKVLSPLFIHKENGEYYEEIKKEYFNYGK